MLLVIDEIATLTAYTTDRKVRTEIEQLLGLILSQGRAVGVNVIAAVQDPSKDVLPFRQLFPTRIALRLTEPSQVAMVLGDSARDRGALCDRIPDTLPGVGYVAEEGSSDLVRVRAFHVTDDDIDRLCRAFAPAARSCPDPAVSAPGARREPAGQAVSGARLDRPGPGRDRRGAPPSGLADFRGLVGESR